MPEEPLLRPIEEDVLLAIDDIVSRNPEFDAERTGTLINTIAGVGTLMKRDAQRYAHREMQRTFVGLARGAHLDRLALDHFQLERKPASHAVGSINIRLSLGSVNIDEGARVMDREGNEFTVLNGGAFSGEGQSVEVQAVNIGPEGNRPAFTNFHPVGIQGWSGSMASLEMWNSDPIAGGNPEENDDAFRRRIGTWWRSLRRATIGALEFVALSVPEVMRVTVSEERIRPNRGGLVDLFVTDGADTYNRIIGRKVRAAIDRDGRAAGVVVNVWGAEVINVPIRIRILQRAGGRPEASARVVRAVRRHVNDLGIGEALRRSRIIAAAIAADDSIIDVEVQRPVADQIPRRNQVIRTRAEEVTLL